MPTLPESIQKEIQLEDFKKIFDEFSNKKASKQESNIKEIKKRCWHSHQNSLKLFPRKLRRFSYK